MTAALRTTFTRYGGLAWVLVCAVAVAVFLLYARIPTTGTETAPPDAAQIANGPVPVDRRDPVVAPGVRAATATARGTFALTGVVVSSLTGKPLRGVRVTLSSGGRAYHGTSDAAGGWTFTNVAEPQRGWTIRLDAHGYGPFVQANNTFAAGTAYEMTSALAPKTRS